jgi:hypothetical protein
MSTTRLPLTALLLAAVLGCGSISLTRTTSAEGLTEGVVTIQRYSSERREEALKAISQACPDGYVILEEGPDIVARPGFHFRGHTTYFDHTEYRIRFQEREPEATSPKPPSPPVQSSQRSTVDGGPMPPSLEPQPRRQRRDYLGPGLELPEDDLLVGTAEGVAPKNTDDPINASLLHLPGQPSFPFPPSLTTSLIPGAPREVLREAEVPMP